MESGQASGQLPPQKGKEQLEQMQLCLGADDQGFNQNISKLGNVSTVLVWNWIEALVTRACGLQELSRNSLSYSQGKGQSELKDSQGLVCRAGHQTLSPELMLMHGVVPPGIQDFVFAVVKVHETIPHSVQDLVFPIAKLRETSSGFMLQPVKLPVKDIQDIQLVS
ncbi:hypothetical protein DUI87_08077 [Hirundo rustica rustica]|uniref:Uncharacterized protein n=1 Tax=Hirundo rustica rustica TaxID=333673 RepID=A0A3M0KRF4_HIRRU|nr:hypothetical protein DUI87_08077 [Hirundo rustica rustica]